MVEPEFVDEELRKSREALADAKRLANVDGSDEGIVNRLYYAAFHAAQAVLYDREINPSSHGAVRNCFGREVVLEGDASREDGRLLTTLADFREQADYGYQRLDVDVDSLIDRTTAFVDNMADLIE